MTDHELLLAISDIVEKKIKAEVEPLKTDMKNMETAIRQDMREMEARIDLRLTNVEQNVSKLDTRLTNVEQEVSEMNIRLTNVEQNVQEMNMHLEQVTDKRIQMLAEVCAPAAKQFEKTAAQMDSIQSDMQVMKNVIREHSEKLKMIS